MRRPPMPVATVFRNAALVLATVTPNSREAMGNGARRGEFFSISLKLIEATTGRVLAG